MRGKGVIPMSKGKKKKNKSKQELNALKNEEKNQRSRSK